MYRYNPDGHDDHFRYLCNNCGGATQCRCPGTRIDINVKVCPSCTPGAVLPGPLLGNQEEARKTTSTFLLKERARIDQKLYNGEPLNDWDRAILEIIREQNHRQNPIADADFYHGSPYYSGIVENFSSFELLGNILFLTPCRAVADEYTRQLLAAGRKPKRPVENKRVVYTVKIEMADQQIFDTRNPDHAQAYDQIMTNLMAQDEDERYRDLSHTPSLRGCNLETGGLLPSFGAVRALQRPLIQMGFRACWISEGSQGASLAVFHPQDATIIDIQTDLS